jgi:hypothetical protein
LAAAAAAVCTLAVPSVSGQDVLDLVPESAEMVVVIPDPKGMSDQIAELSMRVGIPAPGAQDVLGTMMREMGNPEGIDETRPIAMVMSDAASAMRMAGDGGDMTTLMLIPTRNYGELVASLGGTDTQGVAPLVMPDGSEGFIRQSGDYAVLGDRREPVEAYAASDKGRSLLEAAGDYADRLTEGHDVMMLIDVATLGPAMNEAMGRLDEQVNAEQAVPATANAMAANMAMSKWMVGLIGGADAALMTVDMTDAKVKLGVCAVFPEGSSAASVLTGKPGGDLREKFVALPNRPFLMAMAMDFSGVDVAALTRQMVDALPETAEAERTMYEAWLPMAEQTRGGTAGMYVPTQPAMGLSGMFDIAATYDVEDAERFVKDFAAYAEKIDGVGMPMPVVGDDGEMTTADLVTRASVTPGALTIEGVDLAAWTMRQEMPAEVLQQMGPMGGMMQQAYDGYVGGKGGTAYLTTGRDAGLMRSLIAGDGQGLTADGPTGRVLGDDPLPDRAMVGLVSLQGIGDLANNFLPIFGMAPIQVPADLTPINAGMGTSSGQMVVELNLPIDSAAFVVQQAMQLQAMMGGGMGGPGGPSGGPKSPGGGGAPPAPQ